MSRFTEDVVEQAALNWLSELGYTVLHGKAILTLHAAHDKLLLKLLLGEESRGLCKAIWRIC